MMFNPGEQIAYIPTHAKGDITHKDVEFGFVTSCFKDTVHCRFWRQGKEGQELRTKEYSEAVFAYQLSLHISVDDQTIINDFLKKERYIV